LWFCGDLVNRGPTSLATLRKLMSLGERVTTVLGNHDLHLLAVAAGVRKLRRGDTIAEILDAPDAAELLEWVRCKPLAHFSDGFLMVHAGILPQWDVAETLAHAGEVEAVLRDANWATGISALFGNEPAVWSEALAGADRLRAICNALTRMRFCTREGRMEFNANGAPNAAPDGFLPWFDVPGRRTAGVTVVFGHWAALGLMLRDNVCALDSGCVWGNQLSAVRLHRDPARRAVTQVACMHGEAVK
jgi:bis(5'-nucleosyl)-tetraphosphatase (symmetrical)